MTFINDDEAEEITDCSELKMSDAAAIWAEVEIWTELQRSCEKGMAAHPRNTAEIRAELYLSYEKALAAHPSKTVQIRVVFGAVVRMLFSMLQVRIVAATGADHPDDPLSATSLGGAYWTLTDAFYSFEDIPDECKAMFAFRNDPVEWFGFKASSVIHCIREATLRYFVVLSRNSNRPSSPLPKRLFRKTDPEICFSAAANRVVYRELQELQGEQQKRDELPESNGTQRAADNAAFKASLGLIVSDADRTVHRQGQKYSSVPPVKLSPASWELMQQLIAGGTSGITRKLLATEFKISEPAVSQRKTTLKNDLFALDITIPGDEFRLESSC